jgi:pectate lyase
MVKNSFENRGPRAASCSILLAAAFATAPLACGGSGQGTKASSDAALNGSGGDRGSGGIGTGGRVGGTGGAGAGGNATGGSVTVGRDAGLGGQGSGGTSDPGTRIDAAPGSGGAGTGGIGSGGASGKGGVAGGTTGTAGSVGTGGSTGVGGTASGTGGGTVSSCSEPPAPGPLLGWAAMSGAGDGGSTVATTTGGGSATPVVVTSLADLNNAAKGTTAAVIYVKGVMAAGTVKIGSNKTIAGLCGAELHGHVGMSGSVNVIIRNIKIVGYNCSDSPGECKSGDDAVSVVDGAHHIWFDHCDISDGSDGNLDITQGSDFVTVSWTKFHYSTKRTDPVTGSTGHRFSNLIGAADGVAIDLGHLNVTWHHNWWADNIAQRMPRSRDGKIHVVNNLFTAIGDDYCTNSGNLSSLLVENNVYIGVSNPLQEDDDGNMLSRGNVFQNTSGSKTSKGTGFTPPYSLTPDATASLEATIRAQAGPH